LPTPAPRAVSQRKATPKKALSDRRSKSIVHIPLVKETILPVKSTRELRSKAVVSKAKKPLVVVRSKSMVRPATPRKAKKACKIPTVPTESEDEARSPIKSADISFKIPMEEDILKKKYRNKKQLNKLNKEIETKRQFKHFKVFSEDDVFGPAMAYLEVMFRQKQEQNGPVKTQDEDVNSDEDLVTKNTKDCLTDLKVGIDEFIGSRLKREKQELVRNYANTKLYTGKAGALAWEFSQ